MAGNKQMSVYFQDDDTKERLERLTVTTGKSSSEIVEALLIAALPVLEKKGPKHRRFTIDVEVVL